MTRAPHVLPYVKLLILALLGLGVFSFGFVALILGVFTALMWDRIDLYDADGTSYILTAGEAARDALLFSSLGVGGLYAGAVLIRLGVKGAVGRVASVVVVRSS